MLNFSNISLIGMPGVGKSTIGVLLAKALSWSFIDTDLFIQVIEQRTVREIIQTEGIEQFARVEQRYMVSLDRREHVIATGGSVVYGPAAMEHLKMLGAVVHLDLPFPPLERRLSNLNGSGMVVPPGQTLYGLFQHRQPLYQEYADVTVECIGRSQEQIVDEIADRLCQVGTR